MIKVPHAFPYQGSKRTLAPAISQYLPETFQTFIEPFAGSAALSLLMATKKQAESYVISDTNGPLMDLWEAIISSPYELSNKYECLWKSQLENNEASYYNNIRATFNKYYTPEHLLYLLARCVKAAIRYNSQGEFNQSRDKRRLGMRPESMRENIIAVSSLLKSRTKVFSQDYRVTLELAKSDSVVYMDPPYQGTSGDKNKRYSQGLTYDEFIWSLEELNSRYIPYLVSYDGRTGEQQHGRILPKHLGLKHIELHAGRSSQATLLGREADTYESLYLSSALVVQLRPRTSHCQPSSPPLHI